MSDRRRIVFMDHTNSDSSEGSTKASIKHGHKISSDMFWLYHDEGGRARAPATDANTVSSAAPAETSA